MPAQSLRSSDLRRFRSVQIGHRLGTMAAIGSRSPLKPRRQVVWHALRVTTQVKSQRRHIAGSWATRGCGASVVIASLSDSQLKGINELDESLGPPKKMVAPARLARDSSFELILTFVLLFGVTSIVR